MEACRGPIMCHKGTATEEPGEPPFCKHSLFTQGFPAEARFKAVKGNSCWTDSGSDLIEGLHVKCFGEVRLMWEEPNQKREKNKPPVEKRRSREDISIGHELFSETSLFPSSVVSLYPRLVPFPPTEEHCRCGSGAKGKSVSLYVPSASLLSSSISV